MFYVTPSRMISSGAFCIRDDRGDIVYAEARRLEDGSNLLAESVALRMGLEYCITHQLVPVVMETDSLML